LEEGVNLTKLLAQNKNALVIIIWCWQSFFFAVQFHQQNCTQLYLYKQLENTLNFYAVLPVLYNSKLSMNLLTAFAPIEC
jgi:hypothetical protein